MATFDKVDTQAKIIKTIADELHIDVKTVKPDVTFQDLGADSVDIMQVIMKLEELFGMTVDEDDAEGMERLQDVINYMHERRTK